MNILETYEGNNNYNQNTSCGRSYYDSLPKTLSNYSPASKYDNAYQKTSQSNYYESDYYSPPKQQVPAFMYPPETTKVFSPTLNSTPKPLSNRKYNDYSSDYSGGYSSTEYGSNTYKLPDGGKSDVYKYETYQSSSQPITSYSTESVEYINDMPILRDTDTLEQKMLKKSVTQQITEKRTVSMVKSSRQESSSKTFKFE